MIDEKKLIEDIIPVLKTLNADDAREVMEVIKSQHKVGEWIPCSERLPKCNGRYLVWRPHYYGGDRGEATVCYFDGQNTWHDADGVDFKRILSTSDITAWMPLLEPYREEK